MYSSYNPYGSGMDEMVLSVIGGVFAGILLFALAIGLVFYIFQSLGLYKIAKRREIHHAWLAWIPVASDWILGCVSDQYQYLVKGKNKKRRVVLMVLSIVAVVLSVGIVVSCIPVMMITIASAAGNAESAMMMSPMMTMMALGYAASALGIVYMVFRYIALYDLYASCNPKNSVLFLVLGIFFNVTEPFFIFSCRNRDDGMPPRRTEEA